MRFIRSVCLQNAIASGRLPEIIDDLVTSGVRAETGFIAALARQQMLASDLVTVVLRGPLGPIDRQAIETTISRMSAQHAISLTPVGRRQRMRTLGGTQGHGASEPNTLAKPSVSAHITSEAEPARVPASGAGDEVADSGSPDPLAAVAA